MVQRSLTLKKRFHVLQRGKKGRKERHHILKHGIAAAAAAKSLQLCPTLCDPIDGSAPGSPSLGFSRQEHWIGLPFSSPGDPPHLGTQPASPALHWQVDSLPLSYLGSPCLQEGVSKTRRILRYEPKAQGTKGKHINWTP